MGLFRKTMSVSTLGLVSWRNPEQRMARFARQTRNAARAQVVQQAMALEHQRQMLTQGQHAAIREEVRDMRGQWPTAPAPQMPPAGWYPDQQNPACVRWFDGQQWTGFTQPRL